MQVKTKAIVISALKFQEKSLIVKCFTLSDGLKTYFIRDAYSSKKTAQNKAYFQPLTILEINAIHKNKGNLEQIKELKIAHPFHSIHSDIFKSAMILFISEVLHFSIHEEEKNEPFFEFIENRLLWLDYNDKFTNFHLIFLLEATKYLGFYPDVSEVDFRFFEMKEGVFTTLQTSTSLTEHETQLFKKLLSIKYEDEQRTFHVTERQLILKILIEYYMLHLDGFKTPKSIAVLKELFS
ncbi:MAG TPA: DNA repair protein RecO [Flavobacterium sp.]|jgi:DNA repair protein RecO (recombination protein O)|nr:DNA repair protein RecO [Flavobacterium sp.]